MSDYKYINNGSFFSLSLSSIGTFKQNDVNFSFCIYAQSRSGDRARQNEVEKSRAEGKNETKRKENPFSFGTKNHMWIKMRERSMFRCQFSVKRSNSKELEYSFAQLARTRISLRTLSQMQKNKQNFKQRTLKRR